ncbi:MAG: hypothetical protein DELT_03251 [Desulfovibrio sp.]
MHRLPRFKHHKVCDIHDVIDGTDACLAQAHPDPFRGRPDFNVRHRRRDITRAQVGRLDVYADHFLRFRFVLPVFHFRQAERRLVGRRRLARRTDDRKAVGPVCADFKINYRSGKVQQLTDIHSHLRLARKDHDAVYARARVILFL